MIETFFLYTLLVSAAVFLLYFLGVAIAPYAPSKIKNEHFECGLPASAATLFFGIYAGAVFGQ